MKMGLICFQLRLILGTVQLSAWRKHLYSQLVFVLNVWANSMPAFQEDTESRDSCLFPGELIVLPIT